MLKLAVLPGEFGVCRLDKAAEIPPWVLDGTFFSITRTLDELSIVCPAQAIPDTVQAERGWRCLKVYGPLDFGLVGVLSSLADPLARAGISIFAMSTYDTDYLLVRERDLPRAIASLQAAGHHVAQGDRI